MSTKPRRTLASLLALVVALVWLPLLSGAARAADVVLEPDLTINGCNGVLPTPGSENTTKRLDPTFASDFDPGGIVGYVIDFPVDASDVGGDFEITDCVYVDPPGSGADTAIAKYFVHFVPNNTSFQLRFSVPIPANTPLGSQFCNYAKTTASPSASQASNRKAGPACFTVGGGLRIEKRSGSTSGPLLAGATFSVVCTPTTSSPPTIITGLSNPSAPGSGGTVVASGTTDGAIAINGPSGTPCVVTETAAPPGYVLDPTPRNLVIPVGTSQTINVFVNQQLGSLSVTKEAVGAGGTFSFTVTCDDGNTYAPFTITVAAGATETHLVSDHIVVGTDCTVAETVDALFSTVRTPTDGTVTIDANGETVAFTNTRRTGSLVVNKSSNQDGTFSFDVDCTGSTWDTTLTVTTSGGTGSARIDGIPTTTVCIVTEQANPLFSTVVSPVDGVVTIATGDNVVAFTNTRLVGRLVITKAADVNGTFTFDVDCSDNAFDASNISITTVGGTGSATIDNIPTGVTCTVTEDDDPAYDVLVVPANGTVTIATGDNTVAFANTRVRGDLLITKAADVDGTFTFDVDCSENAFDFADIVLTTVEGVAAYKIEGIPSGVTCTVTEQANDLYTSTVVPSDGTVTIDDDGESVAFTNVRKRGSLVVTKEIVDATESGPHAFSFLVVCDGTPLPGFSLGDGELGLTKTIEGIPTGEVCTVTEDADDTWSTTISPENGTVTIGDAPQTVAFVNTKLYTDVTPAKSADPASGTAVTDGDTITYTLTYANAGNIPANITITDAIPAGTTYVPGSAGDGTLLLGVLSWTIEVPAGGEGSVSFSVTVNSGLADPFTIRNVAVLHEGENQTPTNETQHPVAHVAITKAVDKAIANYGDSLTYTLTVTNPGAADLTGVVVADDVPVGTTFVSASDGGAVSGGVVVWPARNLAAGESFTVTWVASITRPAAGVDGAIPRGLILNTAVVGTDQTPTAPSNQVRTVVAAVLGVKIVEPPALPTTGAPLSESVTLALALLLAGAGLTFAARWRDALVQTEG